MSACKLEVAFVWFSFINCSCGVMTETIVFLPDQIGEKSNEKVEVKTRGKSNWMIKSTTVMTATKTIGCEIILFWPSDFIFVLDEDVFVFFEVFEDYARAASDGGQRIIGDMDGDLQSMGNELVEAFYEGAAADQIRPSAHDIGKDFRRGRLEDFSASLRPIYLC